MEINKEDVVLTTDELFIEFSTTQSPFEKWELFRYFTNDAQLIYLPNIKQSLVCNLQFGFFEKFNSGDEIERENATKSMQWLLSHKTHVINEIGTSSPVEVYETLSKMTLSQIAECTANHPSYLLAFNISKLTFKKPSAWSKFFSKSRSK
jgi:hypothetical protein